MNVMSCKSKIKMNKKYHNRQMLLFCTKFFSKSLKLLTFKSKVKSFLFRSFFIKATLAVAT